MLSSDGYKLETDSIDDGETIMTNPASPGSFKTVSEIDDMEAISKLGDLDVSKPLYCASRLTNIFFYRVDFSVY